MPQSVPDQNESLASAFWTYLFLAFILSPLGLLLGCPGTEAEAADEEPAYTLIAPDFEQISPIACDEEYCARYMRDNSTGLCFVSRSVDGPGTGAHGRSSLGPFDCDRIPERTTSTSAPEGPFDDGGSPEE